MSTWPLPLSHPGRVLSMAISVAAAVSLVQGAPARAATDGSGSASVRYKPAVRVGDVSRVAGRDRTSPSLHVGDSPFGVSENPRTGSVYVADASGVAVFDGDGCNAQTRSGCGRTPVAVPAGHGGIGIAVDGDSNTGYVANGSDGRVTVLDGATCNARVHSGCAGPHPSVRVGSLPSHLALDPASHTLYVSNEGADAPGHTLSMINTQTCNAHGLSGCAGMQRTARTGGAPDGLVLDTRRHTLYVSNGADTTVSVVDTSSCNAVRATTCETLGPVVRLAGFPVGGALDITTDTLLVPTWPAGSPDSAGSLSLIDTAGCNALTRTGCGQVPAHTTVGSGPIDVAVNSQTRRAYVVNSEDSDVSVVELARCNAQQRSGCQDEAPTMDIGFEGGGVAVDAHTDTVYAAAQGEGTVTVLDARSCTAGRTIGCRHPAPTTRLGPGPAGSALDLDRNTLYVADQLANVVSVVDPSACSAHRLSGCGRTWPQIPVGHFPKAVAIDSSLDTLYTANQDDSSVSVVDLRSCNSTVSSGCGRAPITVHVRGGAFHVSVDARTHTVYVANIDSDTVSMIDARTCNAHVPSGCGQSPHTVRTGLAPNTTLVDPVTRSLFVANGADSTIAVLGTATCNGRVTSGCSSTIRKIRVAGSPRFLALDAVTRTLYASTAERSLSMIDTRRCSASTAAGCGLTPTEVGVGLLPYGIATDPRSGFVVVGNIGDSTVSAFDGRTCNARVVTGCGDLAIQDTGGWPTNLTVDPRNHTLYVSDNVDAAASVIDLDQLAALS